MPENSDYLHLDWLEEKGDVLPRVPHDLFRNQGPHPQEPPPFLPEEIPLIPAPPLTPPENSTGWGGDGRPETVPEQGQHNSILPYQDLDQLAKERARSFTTAPNIPQKMINACWQEPILPTGYIVDEQSLTPISIADRKIWINYAIGLRGDLDYSDRKEPFCSELETNFWRLTRALHLELGTIPADFRSLNQQQQRWLLHNGTIGNVYFALPEDNVGVIRDVPLIRASHKPVIHSHSRDPYGARTLLAFLPTINGNGIIVATNLEVKTIDPVGPVSDTRLEENLLGAAFGRIVIPRTHEDLLEMANLLQMIVVQSPKLYAENPKRREQLYAGLLHYFR